MKSRETAEDIIQDIFFNLWNRRGNEASLFLFYQMSFLIFNVNELTAQLNTRNPYSDKALLLAVAKGDEKAFRALFDQYRQKIYSLGMYITRSETLSEEIVQDVFLKVWQKKEQLVEIDYFNSWLRTVVKNICSNYLRNLATERLALGGLKAKSDFDNREVDNYIVDKEYQQLLFQAIKQLPPQQQRVYLLARKQGLKQEEIAKQLGIQVFTVKEYMKLAVRSIWRYIKNHSDTAIALGMVLYLD